MAEYGSSARQSQASPIWIVAAVLAVLVVMGLVLVSCGGDAGPGRAFWKAKEERFACPRPSTFGAVQPGFNQQEQEIRQLRRQAFQNDFFSQLELGRRYRA